MSPEPSGRVSGTHKKSGVLSTPENLAVGGDNNDYTQFAASAVPDIK
jgi:hypothetical protein